MRQVARWAGKRRQNADNDPVSPRLAPSGRRHARIVMRVTRGYPPPPPDPPPTSPSLFSPSPERKEGKHMCTVAATPVCLLPPVKRSIQRPVRGIGPEADACTTHQSWCCGTTPRRGTACTCTLAAFQDTGSRDTVASRVWFNKALT